MRISTIFLGVFASVMVAGRSSAADLCDLLGQKGILTSEEVRGCRQEMGENTVGKEEQTQEARSTAMRQEPKHGSWQYRVGSGFAWESAERGPRRFGDEGTGPKFTLALGSRLQLRYTFVDPDNEARGDSSAFRIRRFKFFLNGNAFYPWLQYKLQADWVGGQDSGGTRPDLDDALVNFAYFPFLSFQVGQFKVPFNRQELTSSGALQFVDRGITNSRFTLGRDQGVMIHGGLVGPEDPRVHYAVGVFNGNGKNRLEKDDSDHMGAARLYWTPLGSLRYSESDLAHSPEPRLGLGAAYVFNVVRNRSTSTLPKTTSIPDPVNPGGTIPVQVGTITRSVREDAEYHRLTLDGHIQWRGASFLVDYFFESRDDQTPLIRTSEAVFGQPATTTASYGPRRGVSHTHGYLMQGGYFLVPKTVEVAARFAAVDPAGVANRQEELRGAVSYFLSGHSMKIQADVGQVTTQRPTIPDRRDLELRCQVQVIF